MISDKKIKFSKMYVFDAKIVHIPSSFDRVGTDPLPRYFMRPLKLKEILNYSHNASSVNFGYRRDKRSGLYVKNIKEVDKVDVQAQFDLISMTPPFWFCNETTYEAFIEMTMNPTYSEHIALLFSSKTPKYFIKQDTDEEIVAPHYYVKHIDYVTQPFFRNKMKTYPKFKNVKTYNKATTVAEHISS